MSSKLSNLFKKLSNQTKLLVWVVLFPLLLAGIGVWEHHAYMPHGAESPDMATQAEIQRIEGVLARIKDDRYASVEINGRLYGNPLASQRLRAFIAELKDPSELRAARAVGGVVRPAALVSVLAGVLAALVGALGMWRVHADGQRALHSREDLMASFARWRSRLPAYLTLLLGMQMLAIAALLVVRCGVAYQVLVLGNASRGEVKWQIALLVVAGFLLWGGVLTLRHLSRALKALNKDTVEAMGVAVSRAQAPGLWRYVGELAKRTGAAEPAYVVVGIAESFYVTAHDVVLQPSGQRLTGETMYLPLTYLSLLHRSEIDAVIAHELGHFVGEDTAYSLGFSPIYHRLVLSLHAISDQDDASDWLSMPAITFIVFLLTRFDLAVKHWSREREFAADQVAARVAGHDAIARALIRMTAINTTVRAVVDEVARRPDEAGNDLIAMLTQAVQDKGMEVPDFAQEVATTHPSDTHPPTLERLQAVGLPLSRTLTQSALTAPDPQALQWVRALFADSQGLQTQLLEDFKGHSRLRNEAVKAQLTSMASRVQDAVDIYEGTFNVWLFLGMGLLCLCVSAITTVKGFSAASHSWSVPAWTCLGSIALLALAYLFWRRSKVIVMQLRPGGIMLPRHDHEIPWLNLGEYSASVVNNSTLLMQFTLAPQAPALELKDKNFRRVAYNKSARKLTITVTRAKGMKLDAVHELVNDYRGACFARDQLQAM